MSRYKYALCALGITLSITPVELKGLTDIGTAFTYQGRLVKDGAAVNDTCSLGFGLWDSPAKGAQVGNSPLGPLAEAVVSGLFTVSLDFGAGAINGQARWLEITVQCSGDLSATIMSPRQELTPAPYSIRAGEGVGGPNALNVTLSGDVGIGTTTPAAQLDVNGAARTTTLEITGGMPFVPPSVAWGDNRFGQITVPYDTFTTVAAGYFHNLGLKADGSIVGWGHNSFGQTNVPAPNTDFIAIAAGGDHSLGLKADGSIVAWGRNSDGQTIVPSPNTDFIAVAAGVYHSLGLKADGSIVAWGHNSFGQTNVPAPNTDFIAVAAGYEHSLGLKADGSIVAWGYNGYGQTNVPAPNTGFIAVDAGDYHSLGLKVDGSIVGWGNNDSGQTNVPAPNTGFIAIAAGTLHRASAH